VLESNMLMVTDGNLEATFCITSFISQLEETKKANVLAS
jgi:hypothetical protein